MTVGTGGVKVRRRKVREGEVCVALEAAVGAVLGLVNHLGDELGGERDYEALRSGNGEFSYFQN